MIGAARVALLALGLFIVISVLVHIRRGQWLTGVGPFRTQESVRTLKDESAELGDELRRALGENERLRASTATLTNEVRTLETLLAKAQAELAKQAPSDGGAKGVS